MAAAGATGCGDDLVPLGPPLAASSDLTIVAHQDDDLLLMQPDLYDAVKHRTGITNVYVTAGNARGGLELAENRYEGLKSAYSAIAGDDDWSCGWIRIGPVEVEHCRLASARISLVFLGYPDGGKDGEVRDSLLHLWEGTVIRAQQVSRRTGSYDQGDLIGVVSEIIDRTQPATLRTLEIAATHGHDHSDHMLVGALSVLALARSSRDPELVSYRGYNISSEPPNADPALFERSAQAFTRYLACATGCAPCGDACPIDAISASHAAWLLRRYAIGIRGSGDGALQLGDRCVIATAPGNAVLGDCASATSWQLDSHGALRSAGGLCLEAFLTGEIIANTCRDAGPGGRFFLDDEGHLWSGVVPAQTDDMALAHLYCVGASGGRPRAGLCGAGRAPTWALVRPMTATPRSIATITRTGRAVRMARFPRGPRPMLCAIETGVRGLMCAPTADGGSVLPAVRIDRLDAPLSVEPESLVLGDVDGDGLTDACGSDAGGLLCATAATSYRPARWSATLASAGPATATDRSLAIAPGGQICGLGDAGVVCVTKDATAISDIRSVWPDRNAALWIADLDGDGAPDWCAATPDGPACSLAADRGFTRDGVPWGYAAGSVVEASASEGDLPDTETAILSDVDGDGRDDLCTARDGAIDCARSLGHGFGPRQPIARLPDGMVPTSVWAERVGRGATPRLCAADASQIACTD
jgi:LmbE family N-acetylglucosaminyl deacetylase